MTRSPLASPQSLGPPMQAAVTSHVVGRRTVVRVDGEIDMATAPSLAGALDAALSAGALEVWVDLTPTSFMDSTGVHVLLSADARARELNRRFAIICPDGQIRRLFDVTDISERLPLYEDRAAANRGS